MSKVDPLLSLAIDDNIAWCSAVCTAHRSHERISSGTWVNLGVSPRFYPNIVTRCIDSQNEVENLFNEVRILNQSKRWGIKDSFCDLELSDRGFEKAVSGHWYGGIVTTEEGPADWATITSSQQLNSWEKAWGGGEQRTFPDSLLSDHRIRFWFKGHIDAIEAGFISFDSGPTVGISNWFSLDGHSINQMNVLQAVNSIAQQRPIVCWSSDDLSQKTDLVRLGPLQVWISIMD